MLNPTYQHPLPGATFVVVATTMYWTVGELECVALLRAEDGSLVAASQPASGRGSEGWVTGRIREEYWWQAGNFWAANARELEDKERRLLALH